MIEPQPLFEEYCQRVVKQGDMFICTLEKKFLIPLMDRVKQQYVLHCIDHIHDTSDVIVQFEPAAIDEPIDEPDDSWWKK